MKGLITSQYDGQELSFNEQGWFNATQASNRFNKKPLCTRQISQNPYPIRILPS